MTDQPIINKSGEVVDELHVLEFRNAIKGELVRPGDRSYDSARKVWNGMIDKYPSMIVYCMDEDDVIGAVTFARTNNLLVAVRSGGHNVAGNAVCDSGMVIDLSGMKGVEVNESARTAVAKAGLTLGELDRATQAYGLAAPVGIVSKTGMAGLTIGGGIGWLMRKYGLTCDNLLSAKVVTADGRFLTASTDENSDLFWGIRGGGGNFGIVTEFTFRLHHVGPVIGGMVVYPASEATEIFRFYREYIVSIPDELTTMLAFLPAPPPFLPGPIQKVPLIAIHVCYSGPPDEGYRILTPLRKYRRPFGDMIRVMPYLEMQCMLDAGAPPGMQNYWKSSYLGTLNDDIMEIIIGNFYNTPSPLTQIHIQHLQGAVSRIGENATAFSHRNALCVINIVSKWLGPDGSGINMKWTRDFAHSLDPYGSGAYVNFMGDEGENSVKAAYSSLNFKELLELKKKYDPSNFFSLNQNINPTV